MADDPQKAQAESAQGEEASAVDQLIDMTTSVPEERDQVQAAFGYILEQFKSKESVSALDKNFLTDLIWQIDEALSKQTAAIMKHEDFRQVESAWRGLQFLVQRTDFGQNIQIDILHADKKELLEDLQADTLDQSHLFNVTYRSNYDIAGGDPFGAIIGDYEFESKGQDIDLLSRVSQVAAANHAPFISSVGPSFFNVPSWKEFLEIPNKTPYLNMKEFAEWKGFRDLDSSRYVGLTMPRFVLREPYGPQGLKIDQFDFSEGAEGPEDFLWGSAAWAYASKLTESFANDGWCVRISGGKNAGGAVRSLPVVDYSIGTEEMKIPTEMALTDADEKELDDNGFMSLVGYKNDSVACFFGCSSTQKPAIFDTDEATGNAKLGAMLPYIFPVSRVAHYLKKIQIDNVGRFGSAKELEDELKNWIKQYYSERPKLEQSQAAKYPFKDYAVKVEDNPAKPGWYSVDVWVEPRVVIQGIEGKLHLVTEVKNQDG